MLHALDRQSKDLMKDERTLAMANFYAVEGGIFTFSCFAHCLPLLVNSTPMSNYTVMV